MPNFDFDNNYFGTKTLKNYYGIIMDKNKTPFVHTDNKELLKSISKDVSSSIMMLTALEYSDKVYYCSSSILSDIAIKENMPSRITLLASLLNVNNAGMFCLASVLDMNSKDVLSNIIDMNTGKIVDIPEDTKRQLISDILLKEGVLSTIKESIFQ